MVPHLTSCEACTIFDDYDCTQLRHFLNNLGKITECIIASDDANEGGFYVFFHWACTGM